MLCAFADHSLAYIALGDVDPDRAAPEPSAGLTLACVALVYGVLALAVALGQ